MLYHTPAVIKKSKVLPTFMVHKNELVCPTKLYEKEEYPQLPSDMVKIASRNGHIFVPLHKLKACEV